MFVDQRGDLVSKDTGLYANDSPWLGELFMDEDGVSLLAIPREEIPRLSRLLTATGIRRLSEAISIEVEEMHGGFLNAELTSRLQQLVAYFARILYARIPAAFEDAMETGKLTALWELQVMEVPFVNLQVELGDIQRWSNTDAAMANGKIYYRTNVRSLKDRVAGELSRHLAGTNDLADTFARILMEPDDDGVEEFLRVRSIAQLPADLLRLIQLRQLPTTEGNGLADGEQGQGISNTDESVAAFQGGAAMRTACRKPFRLKPSLQKESLGYHVNLHDQVRPMGLLHRRVKAELRCRSVGRPKGRLPLQLLGPTPYPPLLRTLSPVRKSVRRTVRFILSTQ